MWKLCYNFVKINRTITNNLGLSQSSKPLRSFCSKIFLRSIYIYIYSQRQSEDFSSRKCRTIVACMQKHWKTFLRTKSTMSWNIEASSLQWPPETCVHTNIKRKLLYRDFIFKFNKKMAHRMLKRHCEEEDSIVKEQVFNALRDNLYCIFDKESVYCTKCKNILG